MSYRISTLQKTLLILGICCFTVIGITSTSGLVARAEEPTTPNTPSMGIPTATGAAQTTNTAAPAVPVPKTEIIQGGAIIIARPGVTTNEFKPESDTVKVTPTGATNELKASDLTIQKTVETKAKTAVQAVRTGAVPAFLLIAAPVAVMLWYQYRFIRSRKTSLATTEEKITTSVGFDKK